MKRIHLFEFEDLPQFPNWIRASLTRLIVVMHRIVGTHQKLAELLNQILTSSSTTSIVDLCSGSGGPMPEVLKILRENYNLKNIQLTLTDLYPHKDLVRLSTSDDAVNYIDKPVDATDVPISLPGLRTMICSFHHMKPDIAHKILANAKQSRQPICIFEISDNSFPIVLWWLALPMNFLTALFITPFVRPLTSTQLFFTYIIPIIPIFFAWDGAVSNARTYTLKDLDLLLKDLHSEDYTWQKGTIEGKSRKIYLIGQPTKVL
jgi:hypothetical protein